MQKRILFSTFIFLFISQVILAQEKEENWMISPIKHKLGLSGTFGELRSNHFHTGVDIKSSNGRIGDPLVAIADGHVSRVRISKDSYGKALYIDHPNGKTSVYGHMHVFTNEIENWVKQVQYTQKQFELDTLIPDTLFLFKQGDIIGKMGNSGSSGGPHLHFEIRDTKSEIALNPLGHGLELHDKAKPLISLIRFHILDNNLHEISTFNKKVKKIKAHHYTIDQGVVRVPAWRTNLSIYTRDLMTGVSNKNGIYSLELLVDSESVFSFKMDSLKFSDIKYCNAHIDYAFARKTKKRLHRAFQLPGNQINLYEKNSIESIKLFAKKKRNIEFIIKDYHGNTSTVTFALLRDTLIAEQPEKVFNYYLPKDSMHLIDLKDIKIGFPAQTFYEDQYLHIHNSQENNANFCSDVYHIQNKYTPIHEPYEVFLKPKNIPDSMFNKLCIVQCNSKHTHTFGGYIFDSMIGAEVSRFGNLVLAIDTIPPRITPLSFPYQVMKGTKLIFKIDDNFKPSHKAKGLRYEAFIDNKWILFEYDLKTKRIIHHIENTVSRGKHQFLLRVMDDRDNVATYKKTFIKK